MQHDTPLKDRKIRNVRLPNQNWVYFLCGLGKTSAITQSNNLHDGQGYENCMDEMLEFLRTLT
jgi:hypothetical protein